MFRIQRAINKKLSLTKGALYRWSYGSISTDPQIIRCIPSKKQSQKRYIRYCIITGFVLFTLFLMLY